MGQKGILVQYMTADTTNFSLIKYLLKGKEKEGELVFDVGAKKSRFLLFTRIILPISGHGSPCR